MKILKSFLHTLKNLYNFDGEATRQESHYWIFSSTIILCLFIVGHITLVSFLPEDVLSTLPISHDMLVALPLIAALLIEFIASVALAARRGDRICSDYGPIVSSLASLALIAIVAFAAYDFYKVADKASTTHTLKSFEKIDLGLSVYWADKNVGADKPQKEGDKFAWGETKTKEEFSYYECETTEDSLKVLEKEGYVNNKGELTTAHDAAAANSSEEGWRMPTREEFKELLDKCKWEAEHIGEIKGYRVTGPNGNSIFLPVCATHKYKHDGDWNYGYYWSATARNDDYNAMGLYFDFKNDSIDTHIRRDYGLCIRPVFSK